MNVAVAVIPCAGAGTRLRPATRVIPKPLIPVVDRPVIQYVVEEAVEAGVTEVVLVVDERPGDPVIAHFTDSPPVPGLEEVKISRVVQPEPLGLGDAVRCASAAVGDRPFLCLLSDMFPRPGRSFLPHMVDVFDGRSVVAVKEVTQEFLDRYGIVATRAEPEDGVAELVGAVEKPGREAPSNLGLVGRYLFTPAVFSALAEQVPGHGGEIQLTDAIDTLARTEGARALIVGDDLLDIGRPAGLLEATAAVGLDHPDLADEFRGALRHLLDL